MSGLHNAKREDWPRLCFGDASGQITVTATGGTTPLEYAVANENTNPLVYGAYQTSNVLNTSAKGFKGWDDFIKQNADKIVKKWWERWWYRLKGWKRIFINSFQLLSKSV